MEGKRLESVVEVNDLRTITTKFKGRQVFKDCGLDSKSIGK